MINKTHRLSFGESAPVASGNEGNSQTVKAGVYAAVSEEPVDATIFISGQIDGNAPSAFFKALHELSKAAVKWHREKLPWIILSALCIAQAQASVFQVNVLDGNGALAKPASGVEADFKGGSHPFRLIGEPGAQFLDLGVSQFWFELWGSSRYPESCDRVSVGKLAPDCFVKQLREELHFKESGVMTGLSLMNGRLCSPTNVPLSVLVFNLARVSDFLDLQKLSDCLPSDSVTSPRIAGRVLPMSCDVVGNPSLESGTCAWTSDLALFNAGLLGLPLSLARLGINIGPLTGGFLNPNAGIEIAPYEEPEWTPLMAAKVCHREKVSDATRRVKTNRVQYGALPNGKEESCVVEARYRYTTRHRFTRGEQTSLLFVSDSDPLRPAVTERPRCPRISFYQPEALS